MINGKKLEMAGFDDWLIEFHSIYGEVNEKRSIENIWMHGVEHASRLHEHLRVADYENALPHIADLVCWLCALTSKAKSILRTRDSIQEIVLSKYPRICFYCGHKICGCSQKIGRNIEDEGKKKELKIIALKRAKKERVRLTRAHKEPYTIQQFQEMYFDIYDHINFRTPLEIVMAHLQEEVGEVANCLNDFVNHPELRNDADYRLEFEMELADIITWTVALTYKLDYLLAAGAIHITKRNKNNGITGLPEFEKTRSVGITISNLLWEKYKSPKGNSIRCPVCKQSKCEAEVSPLVKQ